MKHICLVFCIAFLAISINKVQSTKSLLSTSTKSKLKLNTEAKLSSKVTTTSHSSSKLKVKVKSQTKSEDESENESERADSMMGYLAGLSKHKQIINDKPSLENKTFVPLPDFSANASRTTNNTIIELPRSNPDVIMEREASLSLIKEGWLKISSPQLKNIIRFPTITLPDLTEHDIPIETYDFRVNEGYDPERNPNSGPTPFFFWFRLSYRNIYYSLARDSLNVLGNIPVSEIKTASVLVDFARSKNCFKIVDKGARDWILCAETIDERNKWVCKIQALKKLRSESLCLTGLLSDEAIVIEKKVMQPIILIPIASPMCNENFNYEQNGRDWVCDCKEGKNINI